MKKQHLALALVARLSKAEIERDELAVALDSLLAATALFEKDSGDVEYDEASKILTAAEDQARNVLNSIGGKP